MISGRTHSTGRGVQRMHHQLSPGRFNAGPRCVALLLAAVLSGTLLAIAASAHGGYPARLGVRDDPDLALLARIVLVYLVDGQGMNVHLTLFDAEADLEKEYASGEIDLFVETAAPYRSGQECLPEGEAAYFDSTFPGCWAGLFGFALGSSPCSHPALVAHRKVATDLRFTLLRETLQTLLRSLTAEDLELMRREGEGGARDAASAARRLLKSKGLF